MGYMADKVYKKKCKYCGKEFSSLYLNQLNYNLKLHIQACKKKQSNLKKGGEK